MYAHLEKPKDFKGRAIANNVGQKKSNVKQGFGFLDNRPSAIAQLKLTELVNDNGRDGDISQKKKSNPATPNIVQKKGKVKQNFGFVDNKLGVIAQRELAERGNYKIRVGVISQKKKSKPATPNAFQDAIKMRQAPIQRIENDILKALALDKPIYQTKGTTACWILSVIYGVYKAGWINQLFVRDIIKVTRSEQGVYLCDNGNRKIKIVLSKNKAPLWQQIIEGFIEAGIEALDVSKIAKSTYLKGEKGEDFQKRIKAIGKENRQDFDKNLREVLKFIYSGWNVEEAMSSQNVSGKLLKPLLGMVDRPYLSC